MLNKIRKGYINPRGVEVTCTEYFDSDGKCVDVKIDSMKFPSNYDSEWFPNSKLKGTLYIFDIISSGEL